MVGKQTKLIVFDMDGVLIDVSESYREAVRQTARLFFKGAKGFEKLPDPLFSLSDLAVLKQTGGLNNDWDLTNRILHLLSAKITIPAPPRLSFNPSAWEEAIRDVDVTDLSGFLQNNPAPLTDLFKSFSHLTNPFVSACFKGDVKTGNIIKRIFQEIYLGRSLFTAQYGEGPRFNLGEGLIQRERLLIDPALLSALSRLHTLAIATGRPREEADIPLDRFKIRPYFQTVMTLDDCVHEEEKLIAERGQHVSLKKPHPYMLDQIPHRIGDGFSECYYLGDMPDDMQAARSSKTGYLGVGVVFSSSDPGNLRRKLLQAGADLILSDPATLHLMLADGPEPTVSP